MSAKLPSFEEVSLPIKKVEPGMRLLKFLDVPPKLQQATPKTIAFLRKFDFRNLTVRRLGRQTMADADQLEVGDYILAFGRLLEPVEVKTPRQLDVLKEVGFEQVLAAVRIEPKSLRQVNVAQELGQIPRSRLSSLDPRYRLGGRSTTGSPAEGHSRPQFEPIKPTAKAEGDLDRFHSLQEHIDWAQRVAREGAQTLDELYSSNFINQAALKGPLQLSQELAKLVESNPQAGNLLSLLQDEDEYTYRHSVDVAHYVISCCHVMRGIEGARLAHVASAALLHDVGKSKLPRALLYKQGRYDQRETELMRRHPLLGAEILSDLGFSPMQLDIVRHHHVTRKGGYPQFPYQKTTNLTRLTGVADIYQALTTKRPYKQVEPANQALRTLLVLSKAQVDPEVVLLFIKGLGVFPVGSTVLLSNGEVAFVVDSSENSARPKIVPVLDAQGQAIAHNDLLDLSQPEHKDLNIQTAVDHREYFKSGALDLFANLSVL